VGDPRRVGVVVGTAEGADDRRGVRDGVGWAVARGDGLALVGVGVSAGIGVLAAGLGVLVVTIAAGFLWPPPATGMSGAAALGRSRPTPGNDKGSRPGDDTMLKMNSAR
jgi:hypothetical protein